MKATTARAGTSSTKDGTTAPTAAGQQGTTRNGETKMSSMMSRDRIQANADRLRAIHASMLALRDSMNKVAKANQTSVDHYTQWEPKHNVS